MVLASSRRGRSTRDERHARQIALLVAIAAHLFFGVWMLQRAAAPSVAPPPGLILVELSAAPAIAAKAKAVARRTKDGRAAAIHDAARDAAHARSAIESRPPIFAGTTSGGGRSSDDVGQGTVASLPGLRGGEGAGGLHARFDPPKVLRHAPGDYPERAFRDGAEGRVQVVVTIGPDGSLVDARIAASSGNAALDEASLKTVRHYLFKAGILDGMPAQMDAYIDIGWAITPAVVRHYAGGESVLALPPGLATKRAPTRFGSWMKTMKTDAIEAGQ